jgi:hypothetical protein
VSDELDAVWTRASLDIQFGHLLTEINGCPKRASLDKRWTQFGHSEGTTTRTTAPDGQRPKGRAWGAALAYLAAVNGAVSKALVIASGILLGMQNRMINGIALMRVTA